MNKLWEYRKIGDVCVVERGGSPRPIDKFITDDEDGINWIKIGDTSDSMYITETAQKIIPEGKKKSKYVKPGDFLLSNSMSFGRPYILKIDGCIHDGWLVLRDEQEFFDKRFLYYYLSSKTTYEKFRSMAVGGVVNNLNSEMVRKVDVPVPSKSEQSDIADLLDKLKQVLDSRKKELHLLDDLIKARFVEMFGDPILNPNGYLKEKTEKHIDLLSGYPFKSEQYVEEGINICGGLIITPQKIKWNECVHWSSAEGFEDYLLNENDIVMALDRPWISEGFKVAKVDAEHLPALLIQRTVRIRAIDMNQEYLYYCFINGGFDKHSNVTGSLVPHISAKDIRSFEIMIPPAELQNQFADFVNQVNKSKVAVQKALTETQLLFDSLMQQYFG